MGMDLNKIMQQAAQMQAEMEKAQEELAHETVEASAGGGTVTVVVGGDLEVKELRISPEAIDPEDPELLADTVVAAVNEGIRSAQSMVQARLGGMLGGLGNMGLPGM
jgi:DNA-binding YbaB/EbfC family protein